jgi:hypothetical protein
MKIEVTVRSADGNIKAEFDGSTPVGQVKQFAFDHIKPSGISAAATFLTFGGARVPNESDPISKFASGKEHDEVLFVLTWENSAG